jgi:amino acid adenylation domain-containing protein
MALDVTLPTPAVQRFVQVPTDVERSAGSAHEVATSAPRATDLPGDRAARLGAFVALLHRYTQQVHISVDVFDGGRRTALEVEVDGEAPVSSLIDQARAALEAGATAGEGAPSNVAVTFGPSAAGGRYDVHFQFDGPNLEISYNAALIRGPSVGRLLDGYATLLAAAVADPSVPIDRLPLLSAGQLRALTAGQDSGTAAYPQYPVHRLFEAHARTQPEAIAVSFQDQNLTYAELDARSSRLAHHLVACGVGSEVPVAVCVRPSLHVLVAMLAIWKARGLYLPLDPTHPESLIGRMLDEAKPRLVLTTSDLASLTARFPQLRLDTEAAEFAGRPATAPDLQPSLEDAAYLFYTSGTTGKSKGVVATQGNLAQYIHSAAQKYGFAPGDVFVSLARYTFSISLWELLSPLCCGGRLRILERDDVLTPKRLARALEEVTVLHAGPSLLGSLFRYFRSLPDGPKTLPRMRHASSGGDIVPPSVMEEMKRVFPAAELFVIYGCTEIACMGTTYPIRRDAAVGRTFVGKPFPDVAVRVLDPNRNLVPFGAVGEICFAGKGISRGYLDRPELNAEKFVQLEGRRFYATGDMGRLHPDGNLEILGRRDFQIQLRGIRIELAGIERTVLELGLAAQCAVVARKGEDGELRLVAFVVKPCEGGPNAIRQALAKELPDYMVPHHVTPLDAMPLTVNGKLDRNKLRDMPWEARRGSGEWGLASEREKQICDAFGRVLGATGIGVEDGFFDLGGDSLLGVLALEEIARTTGIRIPPHVLFEGATPRALAAHASGGGSGARSKPILLNTRVPGPGLFMLSGVHIYRPLAKALEGRCSAYGVFAPKEVEPFDPARGDHTVEALAREYVELIRAQQPRGPYRLLGYSFGGIVAYEVAHQLRDGGEEVRFLGMVDALIPEWTLGRWKFRKAQLSRLWTAPPRDVATFLWRRVLHGRPPLRHGLVKYAEDRKIGPLEEARDEANRQAAARYLGGMRASAEPVTLVVAGTRLREDPLKSPKCGWEPYLAAIDVHPVDGDHFQILEEPYVSRTAAILATGMQRADARS